MRKREIVSKIFGIALVLVMVGVTLIPAYAGEAVTQNVDEASVDDTACIGISKVNAPPVFDRTKIVTTIPSENVTKPEKPKNWAVPDENVAESKGTGSKTGISAPVEDGTETKRTEIKTVVCAPAEDATGSEKPENPSSPDTAWIYDLDIQDAVDSDSDGYYESFSLCTDADTDVASLDVYEGIYASSGDSWYTTCWTISYSEFDWACVPFDMTEFSISEPTWVTLWVDLYNCYTGEYYDTDWIDVPVDYEPAVQPPTVETRPATSVTETTATINGLITDDGGASVDERRFDWGLDSSCSDDWTNAVTVSGNSFWYQLSGLLSDTTYYFRAWAHSSAGWGQGDVLSFHTSPSAVSAWIYDLDIQDAVDSDSDGYYESFSLCTDADTDVASLDVYEGIYASSGDSWYTTCWTISYSEFDWACVPFDMTEFSISEPTWVTLWVDLYNCYTGEYYDTDWIDVPVDRDVAGEPDIDVDPNHLDFECSVGGSNPITAVTSNQLDFECTTATLSSYETLPSSDEIAMILIDSPPTPPVNVSHTIVNVGRLSASAVILADVPTSEWTYGCTATSAGMLFGYYDRTGYPNMYTGSTNGGVCPLTDLGQGIPTNPRYPISGSCYIMATENGLDGISSNAHVDDYWISYGSAGPDPWEGSWPEHTWELCTADFLGTNQWKWDYSSYPGTDGIIDRNGDGATSLWWATDGSKLY